MKGIKFGKVFFLLFLLICIFSYSNQGFSQETEDFWTGNRFLEALQSKKDFLYFTAYGFIAGIATAYDDVFWKIPKGLEPIQIVDIAKNYLKANPEIRHKSITLLIIDALQKKLPKPEIPWLIANPDWLGK